MKSLVEAGSMARVLWKQPHKPRAPACWSQTWAAFICFGWNQSPSLSCVLLKLSTPRPHTQTHMPQRGLWIKRYLPYICVHELTCKVLFQHEGGKWRECDLSCTWPTWGRLVCEGQGVSGYKGHLQTMAGGPHPPLPLYVFHWDPAMLLCLHVACGCFCPTTDCWVLVTDIIAHKAYAIYCLALCKNNNNKQTRKIATNQILELLDKHRGGRQIPNSLRELRVAQFLDRWMPFSLLPFSFSNYTYICSHSMIYMCSKINNVPSN